MKYLFREINIKELDKRALEFGNVFQSSYWAEFKNKYGKVAFLGIDQNGKEVLSCLMLLVPVVPYFMKIGYIVRGFVGDFTDFELVSSFTLFLKGYMKKNHIMYVAIDPYEAYKTDFVLTEVGEKRHKNMIDSGYIHFPKKAYSMQRPTNYRVKWDSKKSVEDQEKEVWSNMKKALQNSVITSENRGMEPVRFNGSEISEEVFGEFMRLFEITAETKKFGMKSVDYYRNLIKSFGDYSNIWFFKYNAEKDFEYTKSTLCRLEEEINKIEGLEEKARERKKAKLNELRDEYKNISARLDVIDKYKNEKYLSSFYTINFGTRCHLFFGANSPILRELKLTANYWPMLKACFDGKCESFDMGGTLRLDADDIKKDKTYDLYLYKSRYGGVLDELLGEYYLVGNRFWYKILHEKLHYLRRYAVRF